MPQSPPSQELTELTDARALVRVWQDRARLLDQERLRAVQEMSEAASVRRFVLLQGHSIPPLRASSGLVEQQRLFLKLRRGLE